MPPKLNVKCIECQTTETLLWRTVDEGQICQECWETRANKELAQEIADMKDIKEKDSKEPVESKSTTAEERHNKSLRKSTRSTRFKSKNAAASAATNTANSNNNVTKGQNKRSRRNIFKKTPFKLPTLHSSIRYKESVFYKGSYMQIGDIVSLVDREENVYYAQIRGLLVDPFCEKSAYLTWLIPTQESPDPREKFDPATYLIGYDEESPRKLSYLEFVMHAPSNYYYDRTQPFPLPDEMETEPRKGYIWTRLPGWERQRT